MEVGKSSGSVADAWIGVCDENEGSKKFVSYCGEEVSW